MVEVRANDINLEVKSRHIVAYGAVFNSRSVDLGGFTEILLPSAITEETIKQSDVLCLLDHSKARGVLARSNKGKGSLHLSVDEKGLRYEFDAPHTQLGDELLENIQRGEITASSFSFIVGEDYFERNADGSITRYISKINKLTDVSPCYHPAYESTSVVCRSYEEFLKNNTEENPIEIVEEDKVIIEEPRSEETPIVKEEQRAECEEKEEERTPENTEEKEQEKEEETNEEEKPSEDEKEEEGRNIDNKTNPNNIVNKMEKFSLLKTLRDVSENRGLNETAQAVVAEGRSQMSKAGLSASGQITLPTEYRSDNTNGQTNGVFASVTSKGQENVATDLIGLVEPLRNAMVNNGAGVNFLSGLVGDVELAYYDGSNAGWASETEALMNGEGSWSKIKLQPRRLGTVLDLSLQFMVQDGTNAEEMLMRDIQNAVRQKLEMTIYGDEAGDANKPQGLFYNVTQDATSLTYADMVDMQKELMSKNINGNYKIVCSPSAYAQLRLIKMDSGSGRFYLEGNTTVDGIPVIVSNSVVENGLIMGDFSELIVAQWGGIDLTLDTVSRRIYGQNRLVINSYWDVQPRRKEAFVCRILKG